MDGIQPITTAPVTPPNPPMPFRPLSGVAKSALCCTTAAAVSTLMPFDAEAAPVAPQAPLYVASQRDDLSELWRQAIGQDRQDVMDALGKYAREESPLLAMRQANDVQSYSLVVRFARSCGLNIRPVQEEKLDVGNLSSQWSLATDHPPIGATIVDGEDTFQMASCNVLNSCYIHWVHTQGLDQANFTKLQAQPAEESVPGYMKGLNLRDIANAEMVFDMLNHPTHPRDVVALQECSRAFLSYLRANLPEGYALLDADAYKENWNQSAIIYKTSHFQLLECKVTYPYLNVHLEKSLLEAKLLNLNNNKVYSFLSTHVPGREDGQGLDDLAVVALEHLDPNVTTIYLGDINFKEHEIEEHFLKVAREKGRTLQQFQDMYEIWSCYNTNILIDKKTGNCGSKRIDHFLIIGENRPDAIMENEPDDVVEGLSKTIDLL